jgi:hypothetical protein
MSKSILVRAVRKGFYNDEIRTPESAAFYIASLTELGDWMQPVNDKDKEAVEQEMERRKALDEASAAQYRKTLQLMRGVNFENDQDVQRMIKKAQELAYAQGLEDAAKAQGRTDIVNTAGTAGTAGTASTAPSVLLQTQRAKNVKEAPPADVGNLV